MEQIFNAPACNRLPPLSSKHAWFISQAQQHNPHDLFFCTIHDDMPHYRCQIPELLGKRIKGCFYGWLILSSHPINDNWSLWNPLTSKIITIPTLILQDGQYETIGHCCLSSPPDDPTSILLLTRTNKSTFVFFRLHDKRKRCRWIEMSYAKQLQRITFNGKLVHDLTSCNGKVYALCTDSCFTNFVLHVDIVVKDKEVLIKPMIFSACPFPEPVRLCLPSETIQYLKGSSTELFYIRIYFDKKIPRTENSPVHVHIWKSDMTCIDWEKREWFKNWDLTNYDFEVGDDRKDEEMDMSSKTWEEMSDLKEANFFVDLGRDHLVSCSPATAAELGGFIHIRGEMGDIIYSYHVNDETLSLLHTPFPMLPSSHVSLWEYRFEGDYGEAKSIDSKGEMENNEILLRRGKLNGVKSNKSHLLDIPFHLLETILEHSVGVEYMNIRATCKQCHLAAPLIQWSKEIASGRLEMYSVVSPWLMVLNKKQGIITFTDPMSGENYLMKNSKISMVDYRIRSSRFGWLLLENKALSCLVFYNPFTNDLRELPEAEYYTFDYLYFSAPPTSDDCMVVGFLDWDVNILHFVNEESSWREFSLSDDPHSIDFLTCYGDDFYALSKEGELIVFNNLGKENYTARVGVEALLSCCGSSMEIFLTNCEEHLLLVSVCERGKHVRVFKTNNVSQRWEKIEDIGKHMIYICKTTCLCIEAKMPHMENKIFFPRMHTKTRKMVFYSLETCKYHTFDGENIREYSGDFVGTTLPFSRHTWIQPSWS